MAPCVSDDLASAGFLGFGHDQHQKEGAGRISYVLVWMVEQEGVGMLLYLLHTVLNLPLGPLIDVWMTFQKSY